MTREPADSDKRPSITNSELLRLNAAMREEIEQLKLSNKELLLNDTYYRSIFENSLYSIVVTGKDLKFVKVNSAFCKLFEYEEDELIGKMGVGDVTYQDDIEKSIVLLGKMIRGELDSFIMDKKYVTKSGKIIDALIFVRGIYDESGQHLSFTASILDITERKKMERALCVSERHLKHTLETVRRLSSHMETVRENERKRIAREIHDELGQIMTALRFDLYWFKDRLPDASTDLLAKIETMIAQISSAIRSVQRICSELRPQMLDNLGLAEAVDWQVKEFSKMTGIPSTLEVRHTRSDCSGRECATAIFRIFQEVLTNIARHSGASQVTARLVHGNNRCLIEVTDNGSGITTAQLTSDKSYGIIGIRERVRMCNGDMEITGEDMNGTKFRVSIPCSEREVTGYENSGC